MKTKRPSRRELVENPPPEERRAIEARIRLLPLARPGAPGVIDWPGLAGRLAVELAAVLKRLDGVVGASEADRERADRGRGVLAAYRTAAAAEIEVDDAGGAAARGRKRCSKNAAFGEATE